MKDRRLTMCGAVVSCVMLVLSTASWATIAQDTIVLDCAGEETMVGVSKGGNLDLFPGPGGERGVDN